MTIEDGANRCNDDLPGTLERLVGFHGSNGARFAAFPWRDRPYVLLPLSSPALCTKGIVSLALTRAPMRLLRVAFNLLLRARLGAVLPSWTICPDAPLWNGLPNVSEDDLQGVIAYFSRAGIPKLTLLLHSRNGEPKFLLKLPYSVRAIERIHQESRILLTISDRLQHRVPEVLDVLEMSGVPILVQSYIGIAQGSTSLQSSNFGFLTATLLDSECDPVTDQLISELRLGATKFELLSSAIAASARILSDHVVRAAIVHGDYRPSNCTQAGGAFDWEYGCRCGPAGLDLAFYVVTTSGGRMVFDNGLRRSVLQSAFFGRGRDYCERARILNCRQVWALVLLALVIVAVRSVDENGNVERSYAHVQHWFRNVRPEQLV